MKATYEETVETFLKIYEHLPLPSSAKRPFWGLQLTVDSKIHAGRCAAALNMTENQISFEEFFKGAKTYVCPACFNSYSYSLYVDTKSEMLPLGKILNEASLILDEPLAKSDYQNSSFEELNKLVSKSGDASTYFEEEAHQKSGFPEDRLSLGAVARSVADFLGQHYTSEIEKFLLGIDPPANEDPLSMGIENFWFEAKASGCLPELEALIEKMKKVKEKQFCLVKAGERYYATSNLLAGYGKNFGSTDQFLQLPWKLKRLAENGSSRCGIDIPEKLSATEVLTFSELFSKYDIYRPDSYADDSDWDQHGSDIMKAMTESYKSTIALR